MENKLTRLCYWNLLNMLLLNIGRWEGHFRLPRGLRFKTRVKHPRRKYYYYLAHYLSSDWLISCSEFQKSPPGTSSSCRLYNNHVKDTQGRQGLSCHVRPRCMISKGNHVEFARFVLLDVTGRSKNMTSTFASLTEQGIEKIVEDRDSQKTKRSTKVAKQLFDDYVKEKKLSEPGVFLHVKK